MKLTRRGFLQTMMALTGTASLKAFGVPKPLSDKAPANMYFETLALSAEQDDAVLTDIEFYLRISQTDYCLYDNITLMRDVFDLQENQSFVVQYQTGKSRKLQFASRDVRLVKVLTRPDFPVIDLGYYHKGEWNLLARLHNVLVQKLELHARGMEIESLECQMAYDIAEVACTPLAERTII